MIDHQVTMKKETWKEIRKISFSWFYFKVNLFPLDFTTLPSNIKSQYNVYVILKKVFIRVDEII